MKVGPFGRLGLVGRFLVCGTGVLLVAFVTLETVQHLVFGLPDAFVLQHLLYVTGFVLLLLGPLWMCLHRWVLRPLARLIEANRAVVEDRVEGMFIPDEEIPDSEIGEVMRTRNRILEEMRQREVKFRTLVENTSDWVWEVDAEGRYVYSSPRVRDILGYEPEEVVGRTAFEFMASEAEARRVRALFEAAARGRERLVRLENVAVHKDGHPIVLETSGVPILGPDGALAGYRGIDRDITERRRVEEERARMSMAVEQAAESIMIVDPEWAIVYVNPAFERITGYGRAEVIGRHPRLLRSGKHDEAFYGAMVSAAERGEVWSGHIISRRKDGSLMEGDAIISSVRDAAGRVVNHVSVERDVTQEVTLEAQLRQAQKMEAVGTLAGGIAHDFNNLLTGIMGYAELAMMEEGLPPRVREYLARVPEQGRRAADLIAQILTFSRRGTTERNPMSVSSLLKETAKMLQRTVPETVDIRLNIAEGVPRVNADPTQMQQVIMNLCVNAVHAMPDGGSLIVGLEDVTLDEDYCRQYIHTKPGYYVCLSVRDTGVGMTPEVQARIFEPFFTTKEVGKGTGLGLSVVYGIVKEHEGHIHVYSEVGKGSEFKVYIPSVTKQAAPQTSPENREVLMRGTETILLVEDEVTVRTVGASFLEHLGYTVLTAANGEEALRVFRAHRGRIALVLTDVVMPKMGGIDLLKALKQVDPEVKALLMSGYSMKENVADLKVGAFKGFVQKPFNVIRLGGAVRKAIDA